jgi:hypothetical protein
MFSSVVSGLDSLISGSKEKGVYSVIPQTVLKPKLEIVTAVLKEELQTSAACPDRPLGTVLTTVVLDPVVDMTTSTEK